jgi:ATP-binding cassette subfamily B protein
MASMSGLVPEFYSMIASAERLMELENLGDEPSSTSSELVNEDLSTLYKRFKQISFDKVSFGYDSDLILDNATAVIRKGELVAVAGPSGIGKSTTMKLILGLIEPQSGKITLDFDNTSVNIGCEFRRLFAYVPQGNMVLSGTIGENIGFCRPEATEVELINAAKKAMLWDFISTLPEGLNTHIGERGLGLSEGQVQRLAVARAILSDAPILLLDEATSALDEVTEAELIHNIRSLKNKTCIFISHKHRTIQMCDRILNFSDRHLTEMTFEELTNTWSTNVN